MEISKYRTLGKHWGKVFLALTAVSILVAIHQLFYIYEFTGILLLLNSYLYVVLGTLLSLLFIMTPATKSAPRQRVPWYDIVLFGLTLATSTYFAGNGLNIIQRAWEFTAPLEPTVASVLLWLLVLEGGRRAGGLGLFIFTLVASLYPLYAGRMPALFSGYSLSFVETARYHSMSIESIIGIPMRVLGTIFFGFIVMGVTLAFTGAGQFFINLALALCGGFRGGPAKVAVIASGLFGTMSGSAVSNVMATGGVTIPAMKQSGYPAHHAGAVVTCASVGGVLMPPVMGAVAFVMASVLSVPYWHVALAAAVPSVLYYFGLFMHADAYAARLGMKGMSREELPSFLRTLKEGWFYFGALIILVWLLIYLRQEGQAPFYATLLLLIIANLKRATRMNWSKVTGLVQSAGRTLAELTGILAAVGLIIGALTVTGMAITFSGDLVHIAGENTYVLLVMGAITSLILGLGLTVTACYLFLAITLAPAVVAQGLNTLAVHMFVLYWGVLSDITPPVCMSAFASASIARANPMRTGFEAMRLGGILYFLPFYFVLNPSLVLQGATVSSFLIAFGTAIVGIVLIAGGLQGYLLGVGRLAGGMVGWLTRVPLIIGGIAIGWPGMLSTVVGLVLATPVILGYLIVSWRGRRAAPTTRTSR